MKNLHIVTLVTGLILVSFGVFAYKALVLNFPVTEGEASPTWRIEAHVRIDAAPGETMATLQLPQSEGHFGIVDELFHSGNFGITKAIDERGNRRVTWSSRTISGKVDLYYYAEVYRFKSSTTPSKAVENPEVYTEYEPFIENMRPVERAALDHLFNRINDRSTDIDNFIAVASAELNNDEISESEKILFRDKNNSLSFSNLSTGIALLVRMMGVPARPVRGVDLTRPGRQVPIVNWLEILKDGQWVSYDIHTGKPGISKNWLPWWRGYPKPAALSGGKLRRVSFSVKEQIRPKMVSTAAMAKTQKNFAMNTTLFSLPLETQQVYRIVLMVPIGALLIIFLRQIIGIKTFGTFMPVLIALSFRETDIIAGSLMFTSLVAAGLIFRFYFERLKLLSVPRLAAVMIMVIFLMIIMSMVMDRFGLGSGLSVALFPLVILTMTIERMTVVWDEYGAKESIERGLYSLGSAVLAYLVMNIDALSFYLFVYPELLLFILAMSILMGRYTGYRLSELFRFKNFIEPDSNKGADNA